MKPLKSLLFVLTIMLIINIPVVLQAQDGGTGDQANIFDSIVNWVVGIGVPGILVFVFKLWKKGTTIVGKVAGGLIILIDALGDVFIQVIEAKVHVRGALHELRDATEDGKLEKHEIEQFIDKLENAVKEIDDIPGSISNLKAKFKQVVDSFKT